MDGPADGAQLPAVGTKGVTTRRIGGVTRPAISELTHIDPPRTWGEPGVTVMWDRRQHDSGGGGGDDERGSGLDVTGSSGRGAAIASGSGIRRPGEPFDGD